MTIAPPRIGIDPTDLGIAPPAAPDSTPNPGVVAASDLPALVPGSVLAQVLYQVWSGSRVVLCDSPPGAGKTTLIVDVLAQLYLRSHLKVAVLTPTNRAGADLLTRTFGVLGRDRRGAARVSARSSGIGRLTKELLSVPRGATGGTNQRAVAFSTIAAARVTDMSGFDLVIIDEAYQATFADVVDAIDGAPQVLMVGDPGQIGPVVTVNTSPWEHMDDGPHRGAPLSFARREDAVRYRLPSTYRLGAAGAAIVAELYDFAFDSQRPERHLLDAGGGILPEVSHLQIPGCDDPYALASLTRVADRAVELARGRVDEQGTVRALDGTDVAVVVSHVAQRTALEALLAQAGPDAEGVTVGTADSLQGGQWHAVVALDPMTGYTAATPHALGLGRLCVMASRHMSHLTWVHDDGWKAAINDVEMPDEDRRRSLRVRRALTTTPEV